MTYTKVTAFGAVGSGREGEVCDMEKQIFFWVIYTLTQHQQALLFEYTVWYSKFLANSPEVNDQSSDDLNGHRIPLYWSLSHFFFSLFLKVYFLVNEFEVNFCLLVYWRMGFPGLWHYAGMILQCGFIPWLLCLFSVLRAKWPRCVYFLGLFCFPV